MGALRQLNVVEQVSLLFFVIFGILVLATALVFSRAASRHTDAQKKHQERLMHDLRAIWIGAVLFWISWVWGTVAATLLFALVSFLALREFITLTHTRRGDHRALLGVFFVVLPTQYVLAGRQELDFFSIFIPVYAFVALPIMAVLGNDATRFLERTSKIQWGTMVCVYGISHAPALLLLQFKGYEERGAFLVLYLVLVVGCAQVVQEIVSRRLRRRPVARQISRSFSWRAWFVGVLCGGLVGGLLYWVTPFKPPQAFLIGVLAAGCGTLGELVIKAIKRDAGVRRWGTKSSVTGAVGLLDRVAPLCFAAPVFFHSIRWYFGA